MIRADKIWRKIYASLLHNLDVTKHGYFSYTGYKYQTSHKGLDDFSLWEKYDDTLMQDVLSFELKMPFKCDDLSDSEHNNHKLINHDFYQNAYFNFVVETHFDNDTIFLTEKTFKPILNLQPFVIVGNPGSLQLLKSLGYKTFDHVLDNSYDTIDNNTQRWRCLSQSIAAAQRRLPELFAQAVPDILHNQQLFTSSKKSRLNTLLTQINDQYN